MVATSVAIDLGGATHFPTNYQQDFICQAACRDIFHETGYGVIERTPHRFHAFDHIEVVLVGMHIPDARVPCMDRDKSTAGFAQSPR